MLWLALFLPEFPLQSAAGIQHDCPIVLYETLHGRQIIQAVNRQARRAGIEKGMTLASAQPLATSLRSIERQPEREQAALEQLAQWAQQFTPTVSLQPPDGLLLEIESSVNFFHGIQTLQQRISTALRPLQYLARQGVATTPGGAWLLARAGISEPIMDWSQMQSRLQDLPVTLLPFTAETQKALHTLGINTIAECLQLPRHETARRFGENFFLQLDRIFGQQPDPRKNYIFPEQFCSQLILPDSVQQIEQLLFVLQRLLHELCGFLRARNVGAQTMRLGLINPHQSITYLQLSLLSASNDPSHLLKLWQEKLERHPLDIAVEGLELDVAKLLPIDTTNLDLLTRQNQTSQSFTQFLERLRSRLGDDAIQSLSCMDDHLPEKTWAIKTWQPGNSNTTEIRNMPPARPVWLLQPPQPLKKTPQGPWLDGPLTVIDGPERIETGWWDGADQRRDYYIASSVHHQVVWIFQEIKPSESWFLHGFFS